MLHLKSRDVVSGSCVYALSRLPENTGHTQKPGLSGLAGFVTP